MPNFFLDIQTRQSERPGNSISIPFWNTSLGKERAGVLETCQHGQTLGKDPFKNNALELGWGWEGGENSQDVK